MVEVIENQDTFEVENIRRSQLPLRLLTPGSMELTRVIRNDDMKGEYITSQKRDISVGVVEYIDTIDGEKHRNYNVTMFTNDDHKRVYKSASFDGRIRKVDAKNKAREWAMEVHKGQIEQTE